MSGERRPEWLAATVQAVREVMLKRLEQRSLDPDAERDVQMALEELDVMWEELQGRADLLQRELRRYAEFFEFAPDAYLVTDAGGSVREANRAAAELLGLSRDRLTGQPLSAFVPSADRVGFLASMVALQAGAQAQAVWEARIQPASGKPLACRFSVRAIPLHKSGVGGLCWLLRPA
jgi:PAS domain S-box-containing protein